MTLQIDQLKKLVSAQPTRDEEEKKFQAMLLLGLDCLDDLLLSVQRIADALERANKQP